MKYPVYIDKGVVKGKQEVLIMNDWLAILHPSDPNLLDAGDELIPMTEYAYRLANGKIRVSSRCLQMGL
jgi:hypothetical protein